jgi:hypothetical protein
MAVPSKASGSIVIGSGVMASRTFIALPSLSGDLEDHDRLRHPVDGADERSRPRAAAVTSP